MSKSKDTKVKAKEPKEKPTRESRPKRTSRRRLRNHGPMFVDPRIKKAGFTYYWANDTKNRLNYLLDGGWEFVLDDNNRKRNQDVGGVQAYLMAISKEFEEENLEEKEKEQQEIDKAMGRSASLTNDGVIKQKVYN